MQKTRREIVSAIARARADLDQALARLETLADDDRQRVSYSVHALHNYLMVVNTTVALLQTKLGPGSDRDVRRWLASLQQATNLMMSTARGVLTASQEVVPPLLLEPASLTEIAESVCRSYRDIARGKRVRILWTEPPTRDEVLTDRVAASAVLDNLLSNAVKYSTPGQEISLGTHVQNGEVICSVRDHGPGLSTGDHANLFKRGVRLSAQPTAGESSTGYGLAIAKDLTDALGGRLWCTSALGQGSCFQFALPLVRNLGAEPSREAFESRAVQPLAVH